MNKTQIAAEIKSLQNKINQLNQQLEDFDSALENNQYDAHNDAEGHIHERYLGIAGEACEGSYCYGESEYKQRYQIKGNPALFEATVSFEYNRHDKTYYYIDGQDYSFKEVVAEEA
jgi:hypothetical protein